MSSETTGPDSAMRYNGFRSADLNGGPAPGYSTGQAQAAITQILDETLPKGMRYEWTDLTYQQILAGNTALLVFPICVLLVFLVLAAQYESLFLPLAIILIVPMCLFSAITGVWLTGGDNNIFTQIGLFVLIGLACKNAILIVEFARELEIQGRTTARRRDRGGAAAAAPHPDDQLRLHHGRGAAGAVVGRRRGDASRHGRRRVLRHARRDLLRPVPDAGLLCPAAHARRHEAAQAARRKAPIATQSHSVLTLTRREPRADFADVVVFHLSMIFSENRFPLFGIMLGTASA